MRAVVDQYLYEERKRGREFRLVLADMGAFPRLCTEFPEVVVDVGCSEVLAVNTAIGLCLSGMRTYLYSLGPFILHRAWEQIRLFALTHYPNASPLNILSAGSGFTYPNCGISHHSVDDLCLLSTLIPHVEVSLPYDADTTLMSLQFLPGSNMRLYYIRLCPDSSPDCVSLAPLSLDRNDGWLQVITHGWLVPILKDICDDFVRAGAQISLNPFLSTYLPFRGLRELSRDYQPRETLVVDDNVNMGMIPLMPDPVVAFKVTKLCSSIPQSLMGGSPEDVACAYGIGASQIRKRLEKCLHRANLLP